MMIQWSCDGSVAGSHAMSAGGSLSPTHKPEQAALASVTSPDFWLEPGATHAFLPIMSVVPVLQLAGTVGGFVGRTQSDVSPLYATALLLTSHTRARASVQSTSVSCDSFPAPVVPRHRRAVALITVTRSAGGVGVGGVGPGGGVGRHAGDAAFVQATQDGPIKPRCAAMNAVDVVQFVTFGGW